MAYICTYIHIYFVPCDFYYFIACVFMFKLGLSVKSNVIMILLVLIFFVTTFDDLTFASRGNVQREKCPASCEHVGEWCKTVFGRGGDVFFRNCKALSFECTCNGMSAIRVNSARNECTWNGGFDSNDFNSSFCYSQTALCPSECNDTTPWKEYCMNDIICTKQGDDFRFSCTTYEGGTYIIVGNRKNCKKLYSEKCPECDQLIGCDENCCCGKPREFEKKLLFFAKTQVKGLQTKQQSLKNEVACDTTKENCEEKQQTSKTLFMSINSTWTMVLPSLSVLFLFVMLGLARGDCESDCDFQSTALRKTGLSVVQVARRNQPGLFQTKCIPKKHSKSR